jgi:hypothetical protein
MFVLNEFSLFFHNCSIMTPATKKNITNRIEEWSQGLSPPPKKQRTLTKTLAADKAADSVSGADSTLVKSATKSTSCAAVSTSASHVLKKPVPAKRQAQELEPASDVDDEVPSTAFGGLDEDEDDTVEQSAAASSPIRASAAAHMSKVSVYTSSRPSVTYCHMVL